jgi:hypothetical protein
MEISWHVDDTDGLSKCVQPVVSWWVLRILKRPLLAQTHTLPHDNILHCKYGLYNTFTGSIQHHPPKKKKGIVSMYAR